MCELSRFCSVLASLQFNEVHENQNENSKVPVFSDIESEDKSKIKPDVAIIFEIIKVAKQVILVERLASFVCYNDKVLLRHLGLDTYSNLLHVLNYGYISIRFPLQEHEFVL